MQENGRVVHAAGGIKAARPIIGLEIGTGEPVSCEVFILANRKWDGRANSRTHLV
ncbi:MAG: hypothetical protein R3E32_09040 [Chitinophagales bacterium]